MRKTGDSPLSHAVPGLVVAGAQGPQWHAGDGTDVELAVVSKTTAPNVDSVLNKIRAELRRQASAAGIQLAASGDRATMERHGNPGIFTDEKWQEQLGLANALASQ